MENIIIEAKEIKINDSCEVLVCGGGFGGIAAAIAAARQGKNVTLLEHQYILGGLGTAGLITIYLPLCDGFGKQVSFGIAEELFRLSISMGAEDRYPENWLDSDDVTKRTNKDKRFEVQYNPHIFAILVEKMLLNLGIKILYGTYAVGVDMAGDRINAVIIENKSGRTAIKSDTVIDATGDCDIAYFAGVPTDTLKVGNKLAAWSYLYSKEEGYKLNMLGCSDVPEESETEDRSLKVERRFGGLDGEEISQMVCLSHREVLKDLIKKREKDQTIVPVTLPSIPQLRMTRKIVGEYVLDESEAHKYFEDSIGMVSDWRRRGPVFEVPFGTLYSAKVKNLITAGRCTSVTDDMWDIMRVIPCCAVTGEAAGTAAAITNDFTKADIKKLQELLTKNGVALHGNDL